METQVVLAALFGCEIARMGQEVHRELLDLHQLGMCVGYGGLGCPFLVKQNFVVPLAIVETVGLRVNVKAVALGCVECESIGRKPQIVVVDLVGGRLL